MDMHSDDFVGEVGKRVKEEYDLDDGADLCYNLVEMGVICEYMSVGQAAQIVAQHMLQQ